MNDNEKYIEEFIKDVPFDAPDARHRDALKKQLLNAYPKHRLQPTAHTVGVWRIIMKGRISKLAAAAVIIFAVFLALNIFDKTSGIVWADVVKRLEDIKTAAYKITADIKGIPGTPEGYTTHTIQDVMLSYEQGAVRIDSSMQLPRGMMKSHTYILFEDRVLVTVMPARKKYLKVTISDEQMKKMGEEKGDPVTLLKAMLEHEYTELGSKTIDGVTAWGIEVSDPKLSTKMGALISDGMFDETTVQLWVDEKRELPIRINATGSSRDGRASMETVYDNFQWDIDIEPAMLKPEIPDDYELIAQGKWETGNEGEEIIEVLRLFVEYADGKYPASLKTMTVAKAITPALIKKFPPGSPEPSKELLARFMKVDRVGMMYTTLEKDGKDPAYYGDKVSAELPEAVLFRWKIGDDTYRVVFGDLRTEDVSAEELMELESAPLNSKPKAIKPQPADGKTVGTSLEHLQLAWMPGAYVTRHHVYFGTDRQELTLLDEVTEPRLSELPVLERGNVYYWRIDEVQPDGSVVAGDVWSFNTGGLVAWWKLDDGSGTTATDSGDNSLDGSLVGNTSWVDGIVAGALAFDGDGDYVDLGKDPAFDITNQITISVWIKVNAFDTDWQAIINKGDSAWRLQRSQGNTLEFACSGLLVPGTTWGNIFGNADVNDGRWHHVAGTYDGSKICLYVDGKLDASSTASGTIKINDQPVYIGENSEQSNRFWNGLIDDVRIYNYALSSDEITAITQNTAILFFK